MFNGIQMKNRSEDGLMIVILLIAALIMIYMTIEVRMKNKKIAELQSNIEIMKGSAVRYGYGNWSQVNEKDHCEFQWNIPKR